MKIMLIDDDATLLESARELLADLGHEVFCYQSIEAALGALAGTPERPQLVIADFHMPGGSGLTLLQQGKDLIGDIPAVLLTGHIHPHEAQQARELGFVDIFIKPIALPEFIRDLEQKFFSLAHR